MAHTLGRTGGLGSRGLVFGGILLGHLGFFWMMNSGLVSGTKIADRILEVVKVVDRTPEEANVAPPPPPAQPLKFETSVVERPQFDFVETGPAGDGPITVARQEPPPQIIPQEVVKKIVLPMTNPRRPLSQPPYPSASQRLNEEGKVVLDLYVLEDGRVGDATVFKSSGHPRLDQAAVEEAKRTWRLLPGTEDGHPKAMHHQLTVTFRLNT